MVSHRRFALAVLALSLVSTAPLQAQFGGLKKKAQQAAGAATGTAPAQPAKATPPPEVTPTIVDHYLAGVAAGKAERDRQAKSNTPTGKYFTALDSKKAHELHCQESQQHMQSEYQRLVAAQKYDSANALTMVRDTTCNAVVPQPAQPSFEELTKAQGSQDSASAAAAGVDVSQWAGLNEWIPMAVYQMLNNPDQNDEQLASNFAKKKSEIAALRARQLDLATALDIKGPERQKKEAPPPVAAPSAAAAAGGVKGDPNCYSAEMEKGRPAMEAMSKRAQEAQKKGDNPTMMALADSINQLSTGAMRKCGMTQ